MTTTAYTPLESLLVLRSLAELGTDANAFIQTSEQIKQQWYIQEDEGYDPGRLSPDALRELYLSLLREELRSEAAKESGNASPSKKRKLQSPPPLSIQEAYQYNEKLPQLIDRLYTIWVDSVVRDIREDERLYAEAVERERQEEEAKERLSQTEAAKAADKPAKNDNKPTSEVVENGAPTDHPKPTSSPQPDKHDGIAISDVLNSQDPVPSTRPTPKEPAATPTTVQAQQQPHSRTPSVDRPRPPPPKDWQWDNTYQTGPPPPQQYQQSQSYPQYQNQPYAPYPPQRNSFSGPQALPPQTMPPQTMLPSSPSHPHIVLPPPPNMARQNSGSPAAPLDALADIAGQQQYRPPGSHSPSMQQQPIHGPGYGQYLPQYSNRPPSTHGPPPPQYAQPQYPGQYGQPAQNYYPPPQQPQQQQQRQFQPPEAHPQQRQYNSPYHPSQGPRQTLPPGSSTPRPRPRDPGPQTPMSQPFRYNTGKATSWTPTVSLSTPRTAREIRSPAMEPLSPILAPARSTMKPQKSIERPKKEIATAVKQSRGNKRTRASSTASSTVARSSRSHSVVSHADELSLDNEGASLKVKQESATPRADEAGDTTADEGPSRRRRGVLSSPKRVPKRKRDPSPVPAHAAPVPATHVQWTRNFPKISASALEHIGAHRSANLFALPLKERDAPGYKDIILRPQDLKSIRSAISAGSKAGSAILATMEDVDTTATVYQLPISEDLIPPRGIVNNAQLEKELVRMFANAIMYNPNLKRGPGPAFEKEDSKLDDEVSGMEGYEVDENGVVKDTTAMFADVEKIVSEMRSAERKSSEDLSREVSASMGPTPVDDEDLDELAGDSEQGMSKRRRRL